MEIDWTAVATIAAPIIAAFIGGAVNHRFESRPSLISYFSHVAAFQHNPAGGQPLQVNTHQVVLRNAGRRAATNVRVTHAVLPHFRIWPAVMYNIQALPNSMQDVVFPVLVPGEQVTISYLYFPPLTFDQVHAGIKSDQGFAQAIPVLLQRQYPRWINNLVRALMIMGAVTIVYLLYRGVSYALGWT